MGDVTHAEVRRIKSRIDASSERRKKGEAIFIACIICVISFMAGYVLGATKERKPVGKKQTHEETSLRRRHIESAIRTKIAKKN